MKRLMCLLFCLLLPAAALAEGSMTWRNGSGTQQKLDFGESAVTGLMKEAVDAALSGDPAEDRISLGSGMDLVLDGAEYHVEQTNLKSGYDWRYAVVRDGAFYVLGDEASGFLAAQYAPKLGKKTKIEFTVPEDVTAAFEGSGFTPMFHIRDVQVTLPKKLECKATSAGATYFTFVNLLLEDGGYDLTPVLKKKITAEIYGTWEPVDRVRFVPGDRELAGKGVTPVLLPVRAVVLRSKGTVVGAYLTTGSANTEWMMSVKGRTAYEILGGDDVEAYLRAHYTPTKADRKNAKLSPEKVIKAWVKARKRSAANAYEPLSHWLANCTVNMRDDQLFLTVADQPYTPVARKGVKKVTAAPEHDGGGWHYYDVGETFVSVKDYGEGVGWKVGGSGGF